MATSSTKLSFAVAREIVLLRRQLRKFISGSEAKRKSARLTDRLSLQTLRS